MKLTCVALLLTSLPVVESSSFFTGGVGKDAVKNISNNKEFHFANQKQDADEILKVNSFSESPVSSPTGTPRGSLNKKYPSFSSNTPSPRNSESGPATSRFSFLRPSRFSSPTKSPEPAQEDISRLRSASSGDRPNFLGMFLDLASVPEINLETLPAMPMTPEVGAMVNNVSEKFKHYDGSIFFIYLNRTLAFVNQKYVLTPFIVHLAGKMLQHLGAKAPNAVNLFIEKKMPFLGVPGLTDTTLFLVQDVELRDLKAFLGDTKEIKGYSEGLLNSLQDHISTVFLDVLNPVSSLNFDELMIFYMIAFNNCKTSANYASRLATIVKLLIEFTVDAVKKNSDVTLSEINNTLLFEFGKFSQKLYKHYGIDD